MSSGNSAAISHISGSKATMTIGRPHSALAMLARQLFWLVVGVLIVSAIATAVAAGLSSPQHRIQDSTYVVRPSAGFPDIFWIDNERVIFVGAKPGDFVEPRPGFRVPHYALYVWNVRTNAMTNYHEGSLYSRLCFSRGYIHYEFDRGASRLLLSGELGRETLTVLKESSSHERSRIEPHWNPFTCKQYQQSELEQTGSRLYPLLDQEFIRSELTRAGERRPSLVFGRRDGAVVALDDLSNVVEVQRYSRFRDVYVLRESPTAFTFGNDVVLRSWLLARTGGLEEWTAPAGPWMNGSTAIAPTKQGLFLTSTAVSSGRIGAAGGYLFASAHMRRIALGLPTNFDVSPDGCSVALGLSAELPNSTIRPTLRVIKLCLPEH